MSHYQDDIQAIAALKERNGSDGLDVVLVVGHGLFLAKKRIKKGEALGIMIGRS